MFSLLSSLGAISAASFLYIALSDLTPELHQKWGFKHTLKQLTLILVGIITKTLRQM
ncbi:MAG: hypothetical protein ACTSV5_08720 [Promethearchaeota archaeon]